MFGVSVVVLELLGAFAVHFYLKANRFEEQFETSLYNSAAFQRLNFPQHLDGQRLDGGERVRRRESQTLGAKNNASRLVGNIC